MTPEAWGFFSVLTTQTSVLIGMRFKDRKQINRAVQLAEPTGNGFAGMVLGRLDKIDANVLAIREEQAEVKGRLRAVEGRRMR